MQQTIIGFLQRLLGVMAFLFLTHCSDSGISSIAPLSSSSSLSPLSSQQFSSTAPNSSFEKNESSSSQDIQESNSDTTGHALSSDTFLSSSESQLSSSSITESEYDITFSISRGLISEPFDLTLHSNLEGELYFTLLGKEPTLINGTLYTNAIPIASTTIVKAALFNNGARISDIISHSYIFPQQVLTQTDEHLLPYTPWGHNGPDWGMNSEAIASVTFDESPTEILRDIPTLSLAMDWDNWFGPSGIYIAGEGIEKVVTVEYIEPDGSSIQSRSAVEIFGGSSVNRWKTDKLSMKLTFRDAHDDGKFDYPLFEDSNVERFDRIILDAVLNLSYLHPSEDQRTGALYIQDQFVADLHNALGGNSPHGTYAHLYLNGVYWGMYYIHERPDHSFAESYFGGDKGDYDVIKHTPTTVVKGDTLAFSALLDLIQQDLTIDSNYDAVTSVLDIDDYIGYMLINIWAGNTDWSRHNWYATKSPTTKWHFHSWDAEHVLKKLDENVTKQLSTSAIGFFDQLLESQDFKNRVQTFVDREFASGGLFSSENTSALFQKRIDEVSNAMHAESMRWGDNRTPGTPYTKAGTWDRNTNALLTDYFPQRTAIVLNQLRTIGIIQ